MPGPIFTEGQMSRRVLRLRVQQGSLVQCVDCRAFLDEAEAFHVSADNGTAPPPMQECFKHAAPFVDEADSSQVSPGEGTPPAKRLKLPAGDSLHAAQTPPAEQPMDTLPTPIQARSASPMRPPQFSEVTRPGEARVTTLPPPYSLIPINPYDTMEEGVALR